MEIIQNRIAELQDELGSSAGADPLADRYKVGAIQAYYDLLRIEYGEIE